MEHNWKWSSMSHDAGRAVVDKVYIATALLANMHNVYSDDSEYFQHHIDLLQLSDSEKQDAIDFIWLVTNTIYSKQDFSTMLPKYKDTLRMKP